MSMKKSGFTLVETLVAIAIMTLAILAPFAAVERVVTASRIAKDNLIAASLAQEALEYVRFIRDNNYLLHANDPTSYTSHILDGLDDSPNCTGSNKCTVDGVVVPASAIALCPSGVCAPLRLNTASGFYTQQTSGNPATIYTRSITIIPNSTSGITPNTSGDYEKVTATVTWTDHGAQSMIVSENLYDWF